MENSKTISVLNDLLHITNDRIKGFERVEGKVWESYSDLKGEYDKMISQSKIMKNEIINLITERGGKPHEDTSSLAGNLHRTWIDIKNSLPVTNNDQETLENVVFGEKHAIEAYDNALKSGDLCAESSEVIADQLKQLRVSYSQFRNIERYKSKED
ncbi:PA2169 family four-helix-bundle protein [Chryseobacterium sp. CFS15]|uniref:PA2169 family four-helix-bundle protein n=1 Tax=Chryseobacterium sp. CFS15 TaxID=2986946 RepID=UPI002806F513|nr:PA2169 family four-helix-bundle protein [Chryseobacterium sp. CFS15]MDQ8143336.1 PA2169 family four-helix-bundle protein [Chryseobacterium sp. CFS15]